MPFDSLFTGVSGLDAFQNQIDVISNNIANVGTTGFKEQRVTFQDLLYQTQRFTSGPTQTLGGVNAIQAGLGVKVGTVDSNFAQGGLQTTGINTDLALSGDGFFILNNSSGNGTPVYTRDGAFSLNQNGLLYDPSSGLAVQGYTAVNGVVTTTGTPGSITIPIGLKSQATGTGFGVKTGPTGDSVYDVTFGGNLDATQWSARNNGAAFNISTISTTVYDTFGSAHQLQLTYIPVVANMPVSQNNPQGAPIKTGSAWNVYGQFTDGTKINGAAGAQGLSNVYFDANGQFINTDAFIANSAAVTTPHLAGAPPATANGDLLVASDWGGAAAGNGGAVGQNPPPSANIGLGYALDTALSGNYTPTTVSQNGFTQGTLSNISVGQDGTVTGAFTNGQNQTLAQVSVATFQNEQGLLRLGNNQFSQSANSGLAQVGTASTGRFGSIVSGSLESSNVSLADEFTKMIFAQRAFEANGKGITTADENLQTVIGLKR